MTSAVACKISGLESDISVSMEELINTCLDDMSCTKIFSDYGSVNTFITKPDKTKKFINLLLNDTAYDEVADDTQVSLDRAQHIAVTYLLGLVLWPFVKSFLPGKDVVSDTDFKELWLLTALYHDLGYYSDYIYNSSVEYSKISKYDLFTDAYRDVRLTGLNDFSAHYPQAFAHSYSQILKYDQYAREYHTRNATGAKGEMVDHGILGGVLSFRRMLNKAFKGKPDIQTMRRIKYVSVTVAQHNIFKSGRQEDDANYEKFDLPYLAHDSKFKVTQETPLRLLLSLVDTIECVKKFGQGNLKGKHFRALTVLQSIYLSVKSDCIILDFTKFRVEWNKKNFPEDKKDLLDKYLKSLKELDQWTSFQGTPEGTDIIKITLTKM